MKLTNKEFIKNIEKKYTFEKKPSVAVAVSGGPDSMSLLFLVNAFIKYKKGNLMMTYYLDHQKLLQQQKVCSQRYIFF